MDENLPQNFNKNGMRIPQARTRAQQRSFCRLLLNAQRPQTQTRPECDAPQKLTNRCMPWQPTSSFRHLD